MLKIETIVRSARTENTQDKKQAPAYRAPRVIEVGKASDLLQGWACCGYRDASNFNCVPY